MSQLPISKLLHKRLVARLARYAGLLLLTFALLTQVIGINHKDQVKKTEALAVEHGGCATIKALTPADINNSVSGYFLSDPCYVVTGTGTLNKKVHFAGNLFVEGVGTVVTVDYRTPIEVEGDMTVQDGAKISSDGVSGNTTPSLNGSIKSTTVSDPCSHCYYGGGGGYGGQGNPAYNLLSDPNGNYGLPDGTLTSAAVSKLSPGTADATYNMKGGGNGGTAKVDGSAYPGYPGGNWVGGSDKNKADAAGGFGGGVVYLKVQGKLSIDASSKITANGTAGSTATITYHYQYCSEYNKDGSCKTISDAYNPTSVYGGGGAGGLVWIDAENYGIDGAAEASLQAGDDSTVSPGVGRVVPFSLGSSSAPAPRGIEVKGGAGGPGENGGNYGAGGIIVLRQNPQIALKKEVCLNDSSVSIADCGDKPLYNVKKDDKLRVKVTVANIILGGFYYEFHDTRLKDGKLGVSCQPDGLFTDANGSITTTPATTVVNSTTNEIIAEFYSRDAASASADPQTASFTYTCVVSP